MFASLFALFGLGTIGWLIVLAVIGAALVASPNSARRLWSAFGGIVTRAVNWLSGSNKIQVRQNEIAQSSKDVDNAATALGDLDAQIVAKKEAKDAAITEATRLRAYAKQYLLDGQKDEARQAILRAQDQEERAKRLETDIAEKEEQFAETLDTYKVVRQKINQAEDKVKDQELDMKLAEADNKVAVMLGKTEFNVGKSATDREIDDDIRKLRGSARVRRELYGDELKEAKVEQRIRDSKADAELASLEAEIGSGR